MALLLRYIDDMHNIMNKHGGQYIIFLSNMLNSHLYIFIVCTFSDPRTNDWLLMSSPIPTLAICLSYVYLVKVI